MRANSDFLNMCKLWLLIAQRHKDSTVFAQKRNRKLKILICNLNTASLWYVLEFGFTSFMELVKDDARLML